MNAAFTSKYHHDAERNVWFPTGASERFGYSDGDEVENRIHRIIREASDKSVGSPELASHISDWPSLYHLSPDRANVLRPVIERLEGPVLEIGSGCGAITRFLGESGLQVTAVEGSPRRAAIGAERCRDLPNVTVVADTFQNFDIGQKFKTITLIGVLEYARVFYGRSTERDPIDMMLERVASLLAPDGVLVIAIENQIGLKYFAGFSEDHLGQPMIGIEGRYTPATAVTFGRKELGERIAMAGLGHHEWWYPFPDYKMPVSVLSDAALEDGVPADFTNLIAAACGTDKQRPRVQNFSMNFAWQPIVKNGLIGDLSNSFIVMASPRPIEAAQAFGFHYGSSRDAAFRKLVEFGQDEDGFYVERRRTVPDAQPKIPGDGEIGLRLGREPMIDGKVWRDELQYILNRDGWQVSHVADWMRVWWDALANEARKSQPIERLELATIVPGELLDATPRNMLIDKNGHIRFIDLEWQAEQDLDAGYLFFRAMLDGLFGAGFCAQQAAGTPRDIASLTLTVAHHLGLKMTAEDLTRYLKRESLFQSIATGTPQEMTVALLGRQLPGRALPHQLIGHLEQLVKTRDGEIAQVAAATQQMQQKVHELTQSLENQLAEAHHRLQLQDKLIQELQGNQQAGLAG